MTGDDATAGQVPLCVDLDGTLLRTDAGIESGLALLRRNPLYAFAMLYWLLGGLARLKHEVAQRAAVDVTTLPWDLRVLDWVRQESGHRDCLLVTASDQLLAESVAAHLGCFAGVMASDGKANLAGGNKARALVERFGDKSFDYAGNSSSDLAVWPHARKAIVANAFDSTLKRALAIDADAKVFPRRSGRLRDWIDAMRLRHWPKNLLLFAPLIGAHGLGNLSAVLATAMAALLFSLCASGTYLVNDLFDLAADRRHPHKRNRPLASGRVDMATALAIAPILVIMPFLAGAWTLPPPFTGWLGLYLVLTLAYSVSLKRLFLVDVVVLAVLFMLRILAGGAATGVTITIWLATFALPMFFALALVKRLSELQSLREQGQTRAAGRAYHRRHRRLVHSLGILASAVAVLILAMYPVSGNATDLYAHPHLLWVLSALLAWWSWRLWQLANSGRMHHDPIMFALRDWQSWALLVASAAILWIAT